MQVINKSRIEIEFNYVEINQHDSLELIAMDPFQPIRDARASYEVLPIFMRELLYLSEAPCDIFGLTSSNKFKTVLEKNSVINHKVLKKILSSGQTALFAKEKDHQKLIHHQQENLRNVTRSLSVGDIIQNGKKQLGILTINLQYLYEDPTNDTALKLIYQSVKNLSRFLFNNPEIHPILFHDYVKQKHYYIFAQPLLSSFFLLGVLKQSHLYSEKETESLFITSYFKDIGMSSIPIEKYDCNELSDSDKSLLSEHAENSVSILEGRIPLGPTHLKIIENHHIFSGLNVTKKDHAPNDITLAGFETMITSATDIIAAMISERPYRQAENLYDALSLTKMLIADQYPQEFKLIVHYLRQFFDGKNKVKL